MRTRPYTTCGIRRVPCARCGEPSHHQWNVCALPGQFHAVCTKCDIGLNRAALEYMGWPNLEQIVAAYAQRIEARSDETPQEVRPVGREPDGEADAPNLGGSDD